MIAFNGCGQANPNAKLTAEQVEDIRSNPDGLGRSQLAHRHGVHPMTISRVKHRHVYAKSHDGRNYNAKITFEDAERIRELVKGGMLRKDAAEMYGLSDSAVSKIVLGKAWV